MPPRPRPSSYNVVATFDGMDAARAAIAQLERRGIDAVHISLSGEAAREASHASASTDTYHSHDAAGMGYVARRSVAGGFVLGAALAIVGFIIGLFIHRPVNVGYALTGLLVGAIIGSVLGFMWLGTLNLPVSSDWELTFEQVESGRVVVGVHANEPAIVQTGTDVLSAAAPLTIERYDSRGRRVAA